jgi:ribonuclease G
MSEEILINVTPQETRVAVMQLGVVQDLHIERSSSRGIVSNVYLGKVKRVLPGMQSAFRQPNRSKRCCMKDRHCWCK